MTIDDLQYPARLFTTCTSFQMQIIAKLNRTFNSTHHVKLYPQHGDCICIVTIDSVTSFHPMCTVEPVHGKIYCLVTQRFSNWGPRTKGGPLRVPTGSARGFRKVVIVCTVFNNLRPIYFQICKHKSVTQSLSQCIAWKCCRGLARQAFR